MTFNLQQALKDKKLIYKGFVYGIDNYSENSNLPLLFSRSHYGERIQYAASNYDKLQNIEHEPNKKLKLEEEFERFCEIIYQKYPGFNNRKDVIDSIIDDRYIYKQRVKDIIEKMAKMYNDGIVMDVDEALIKLFKELNLE